MSSESSIKKSALHGLAQNTRGAVIVEAAIALPMMIVLLLGSVTYGGWFMAAHSLQQAANSAARAAVAGVDDDERAELVASSIDKSVLNSGTLQPQLVDVETSRDGRYYTVSLSYDVGESKLFKASLVPLPGPTIDRFAVMELSAQ